MRSTRTPACVTRFLPSIAAAFVVLLFAIPARADLIQQSATSGYVRTVLMTASTDHITAATGLTLTVQVSKAGGSFATVSRTVTEIGSGRYAITLTQADLGTLGALDLHVTATGADPSDSHDQVVAFNPNDPAALGLSGVPISMSQSLSGSPSSGTTGEALFNADKLAGRRNTAQAAGSDANGSYITLDAGASSIDNTYAPGYRIDIASGTGAGQSRTITTPPTGTTPAYSGTTKKAYIDSRGWSTVPDSTSVYIIYPTALANVGMVGNQVASAPAPVAFPANIGTSTYAGADTSGTVTLLGRIPGTVQPQSGDSYARLGAPAGASHAADIAANLAAITALPTASTNATAVWASGTRSLTTLSGLVPANFAAMHITSSGLVWLDLTQQLDLTRLDDTIGAGLLGGAISGLGKFSVTGNYGSPGAVQNVYDPLGTSIVKAWDISVSGKRQ